MLEVVKHAEAATDTFAVLTANIPSGTPDPDRVQRIHNDSRELCICFCLIAVHQPGCLTSGSPSVWVFFSSDAQGTEMR